MEKEKLDRPIEIVKLLLKKELQLAFERYYGEDLDPQEKPKRKNQSDLERAVGNLEFVDYLSNNCPSLKEYFERIGDHPIRIQRILKYSVLYTYGHTDLIFSQKGLEWQQSWDDNYMYGEIIERSKVTPEFFQKKWDEPGTRDILWIPSRERRLIRKFGNLSGEQIVKKISKTIK